MPTRKWGSEQVVNTTTAGSQFKPQVAALANGGFVVVRQDESVALHPAIRGQRYDALGNKVGTEMLISETTDIGDFEPVVTGLASGGFFVSWTIQRNTDDSEKSDVTGKVFDANSTRLRWQEPVPYQDISNHARTRQQGCPISRSN